MNVSDRIADWLAKKGFEDCFTITGSGVIALLEAIANKKATRIWCFHQEQAALQAAIIYYKATGKHAACVVTTGAGSTNAITGVLSAWMDSVPLMVIAGNEPEAFLHQPTRVKGAQGFEFAKTCGETMTKYYSRITSIAGRENYTVLFDDAYKRMVNDRKGPVLIEVPTNIQNEVIQ